MNSLQGEIIESHENSKCFQNFSNKLYNKLLILDQKWFPFLIFLMIYSAKNSEFVFRIEPSAYHAFFFSYQKQHFITASDMHCAQGRSQTTFTRRGRQVGGTRNVNGMQIFPYTNKVTTTYERP